MGIMRRRASPPIPTRADKGWRQTEGSIVVEASILLPMILLLFLFFVYLIQAAVISTALQSAASNAVKQVAAHLYPIQKVVENAPALTETGALGQALSRPPAMLMKLTAQQFVHQFGSDLPEPLSGFAQDAGAWFAEQAEALGEQAQAAAGQALFHPLLQRYGVQHILKPDKVRVTHLRLPDLKEKREPFVALQVEYDLPMRVPLLMKTVTLTARASERAWIGDGPPPETQSSGSDQDKQAPQIVSIEPNPLKPGHGAKLTAKAAPHEQVKLIVYYKSGESIAKGLVWKQADTEGNVSWDWHVSGSTTEGTWRLKVISESGAASDMSFGVE